MNIFYPKFFHVPGEWVDDLGIRRAKMLG